MIVFFFFFFSWSVRIGKNLSHHAPFGGLAQQSSEGDDGRHAGAVQEEEGGQTLKADGVGVVGQVVGGLALDVQDEAAKYPVTVTASDISFAWIISGSLQNSGSSCQAQETT